MVLGDVGGKMAVMDLSARIWGEGDSVFRTAPTRKAGLFIT
jgi:hypothetical protein